MDPCLVAAGGFVLLGLGCLGADLYNIATPHHNSVELWSAEAVDLATGLAAAAALIYEGSQYLYKAWEFGFDPEDSELVNDRLSPILYTLALAESLEMLMGFGTPYQGDDLRHGAQQLAALGEQLQGTTPGSGWRGTAAQAYTEQVEAEQGAAGILATIDLGFAELAQQCANFVTHARLAIGLLKALLLAGYIIERTWYVEDNPEEGWTFAGKVSVAGATAVTAIGFAFGVYFANKLKDGAGTAGDTYDKVGPQPSPPTPMAVTVTAAPSVAEPAQRSGGSRFFFSTGAEAATMLPGTAPPPAPQTPSARTVLGSPTFAAPSGSGPTTTRRHTRSAPLSKPNADQEAPPVDETQPELEVHQQVPFAAAGAGSNQAAARMPAPAS